MALAGMDRTASVTVSAVVDPPAAAVALVGVALTAGALVTTEATSAAGTAGGSGRRESAYAPSADANRNPGTATDTQRRLLADDDSAVVVIGVSPERPRASLFASDEF